jgi:polar amino acid transport system substrate-binding protein
MKKIISLVLAAALMLTALFAFTGCAGKDDGVLVCGVTLFENMNEQDENGNWTGFESEFAMEVGKLIDMEVKFQIIDWGQKYNELNSGKIDCIWNGFTANSSDNGIERKDLVDFSYTYMLNQQCVVINKKNAETIKTEADLAGKKAAVEAGSAGAAYAKEATGSADNLVTFTAQNSTFMEVKTGKSDIAVVDILLAQNICGKGDYEDLMIVDTITLDAEYYAVGFKKNSPLTAKVNEAIKTLNENGKLLELARKYGLENSLKVEY